ncbi:MAG TPA: hypothetical protein VK013_09470 [Myxococcaceae bacterium]|nr:hypothetical protein [Myxococcaceae bacterium]
MAHPPRWLESLKKEPRLAAAGLRWLTPEEAASHKARALMDEGEPSLQLRLQLAEKAFSEARAKLAEFVPVAEGPSVTDQRGRVHPSLLWIGEKGLAATELKLALSPLHPPAFWVSAGQTATTVQDAVSAYFPKQRIPESAFGKVERGYLGNNAADGLDLIKLHDRYAASPFMDPVAWGSAHAQDPRGEKPLSPGHRGRERARDYRAQDDDPRTPATYTFRTLHSQSILRVEAHLGVGPGLNVFVAELRYQPVRNTAPVERLNRDLGTRLPTDLPLDLAGALVGLRFDPADRIHEALKGARPEQLHLALMCLAALAADDAAAEAELEPFSDHPEESVRRAVAHLAERGGLHALLNRMAQAEASPSLREELGRAIAAAG